MGDMIMSRRLRWGEIFTYAGAFVAYLIGSGFASGQEAMQYFTAFGIKGALGAAVLTLIIYIWFSITFMQDGYRLKDELKFPNDIFQYYCGKYLGRFYEVYIPIFLFLTFMIMISGAGATLTEYYGLHSQVGRIIMALLALGTVLMGLNKLLNIVSKLGPVIILFAVIIGIANIVMHPEGFTNVDKVIATVQVTKAAPAWYISGIIFPSMGCIMIAPFLVELGINASGLKEAKFGGFLGSVAFSVAVAIMGFGLMASIGALYDKNVPALFIAQEMFPAIGVIFSLILFAGIYTASVLMLWLSSNALGKNESTKKFKIIAVVLTIAAFIGGQFPFAKLVNVLYPISGYLGILLFCCILYKQIKDVLKRRKLSIDSK
jgi:uncharacterized membrane protein YkvI